MRRFDFIFAIIWLSCIVLISVPALIATLTYYWRATRIPPDAWLGIAIPLLLLAIALAVVRFGRYLARDDPQFLTDFIVQVLNARRITP